MVQAFDAAPGDGVPETVVENAHQSLIGEVIDFVKEHKTASTIAGIGVAAGAIYLARAPLGRILERFGGGLFAAQEAASVATRIGSKPIGRELAVAGEELIVSGSKVEPVAGAVLKAEGAVVGSADSAAVGAAKTTEVAAGGAGGDRSLLDALGKATREGKVSHPEPWVYHPENRGMLKDLPKGGASEIHAAGESIESIGTVGSTHSPDAGEITKIAFPGISRTPAMDLTKYRFLKSK